MKRIGSFIIYVLIAGAVILMVSTLAVNAVGKGESILELIFKFGTVICGTLVVMKIINLIEALCSNKDSEDKNEKV